MVLSIECTFSRNGLENVKSVFLLYLFNITPVGGKVVLDDGWLVGVSELHLQFGTCCLPISIPSLPDTLDFCVKIQSYCCDPKKVCISVQCLFLLSINDTVYILTSYIYYYIILFKVVSQLFFSAGFKYTFFKDYLVYNKSQLVCNLICFYEYTNSV